MRADRTIWRCSRCNAQENLDLGKEPHRWWSLVRTRLGLADSVAISEEWHLCCPCVLELDRWIRNDPEQMIVNREYAGRSGIPTQAPFTSRGVPDTEQASA